MNKAYEAVFFDFDGVILDSVDVKTRAFGAMFSDYGKDIETAVIRYHLENKGVSRYEKFKYYYEKLLHQPITETKIQTLGQTFSDLALKSVLAAPFIPGAMETLEKLKSCKIPCYVVSGTPDKEMKLIVKEKGLSAYFKDVYGSPRTKIDITKEILQSESYNPSNCLFIGDALSDYDCAKALNVPFLGIIKQGEESIFPGNTIISSFVTLELPSKCTQTGE